MNRLLLSLRNHLLLALAPSPETKGWLIHGLALHSQVKEYWSRCAGVCAEGCAEGCKRWSLRHRGDGRVLCCCPEGCMLLSDGGDGGGEG